MKNNGDSIVNKVETALEQYKPCEAKALLSDMSFDEIKDTLVAVQKENAHKRNQGEHLPNLAVSIGDDHAIAYSMARPYQDELSVFRDKTNGKVSITTPEKCD